MLGKIALVAAREEARVDAEQILIHASQAPHRRPRKADGRGLGSVLEVVDRLERDSGLLPFVLDVAIDAGLARREAKLGCELSSPLKKRPEGIDSGRRHG